MAKTTAKPRDRRLYWTPTIQVRAGLARIEELGLYGDTVTQIVNHVLTEEIRRLLSSGLLTRESLDGERKRAKNEWESAQADRSSGSE
jgi:hypothetical protein